MPRATKLGMFATVWLQEYEYGLGGNRKLQHAKVLALITMSWFSLKQVCLAVPVAMIRTFSLNQKNCWKSLASRSSPMEPLSLGAHFQCGSPGDAKPVCKTKPAGRRSVFGLKTPPKTSTTLLLGGLFQDAASTYAFWCLSACVCWYVCFLPEFAPCKACLQGGLIIEASIGIVGYIRL